jgi:hypothetical protein
MQVAVIPDNRDRIGEKSSRLGKRPDDLSEPARRAPKGSLSCLCRSQTWRGRPEFADSHRLSSAGTRAREIAAPGLSNSPVFAAATESNNAEARR